MRLLDRLRGIRTFRPVIAGHPALGPVVPTLLKRDLAPACELFAATRERWHLRWLLVRAIRDHYVSSVADLAAWIERTPRDPLPYLVRAFFHTEAAWEARGRGRADGVTDDGWRKFREHMTATVPDLERAAELEPSDPTPHYIWMGAAPGIHELDAARAAMLRHYEAVLARAPDHYPAHRRASFYLSERWYGSHAESLDVARRAAKDAPDGSELPILILMAHETVRAYLFFFDRNEERAIAYTRDPQVLLEVDSAYARSLGSRAHRPTDLTMYRRHEAALWFWSTGDKDRARVELEQLGDLFDPDDDPWHISTERYRMIRKQCGL